LISKFAIPVVPLGETPFFAPDTSPGWSVTFPSAPRWSADLAAGEACKP
jgi:hypothetical protein